MKHFKRHNFSSEFERQEGKECESKWELTTIENSYKTFYTDEKQAEVERKMKGLTLDKQSY